MAGGSAPKRTLSAASLSPERVGPPSNGDSAARRPRIFSAVVATDRCVAGLPAPISRSKRVLEVVRDVLEDLLDVDTGRRQDADRDHGNERDDQRVLDERLAFLGPHLRQLNPRSESLNHFLAPFLPSGVDVMFVLLLSIDRPTILSVVFA